MAPMDDDPLDRLRIASPCEREWERMAGDERVRHCTLCERKIYNFAEMTRDEIVRTFAEERGGVCGRLTRRSDGTVRTRDDSPRGSAQRFRGGNAVVAMLLTAVAFASGCATKPTPPLMELRFSLRLEGEAAASAAVPAATYHGVVFLDYQPLPGVTVTLRDEANGQERTAVTDGNGAFVMSGLPEGLYHAQLMLDETEQVSVEHVALKAGKVTRASATLRLAGESITVGAMAPGPLEDVGISTTFTQDLIDKLPI